MGAHGGKPKEIVLGNELGDIVVKANGAKVEIDTDGSIVAYTRNDVDAYTMGAVRANTAAIHRVRAKSQPRPGDVMDDGTIYAGISPDTGKAMFTTPADAPLTKEWEAAMKCAKRLDANGNRDWRLPTKAELNVLFENRDRGALKGTFNVTGSDDPAGWYWSSTEYLNSLAWGQRFSDGFQDWSGKSFASSLRCVRG